MCVRCEGPSKYNIRQVLCSREGVGSSVEGSGAEQSKARKQGLNKPQL